MSTSRTKTLLTYVIPAILTNMCVFLLTIIEGLFVGNGVGTDALGAINIVLPFVMIAYSLDMLTSMGGVTIAAVRLGRGDKEGANQAFMHAVTANFTIAVVITLLGVVFTEPLSRALGADGVYLPMVKDYMFVWSLFAIPGALSVVFQFFCRNDGSPILVSVASAVSTVVNIFLAWLFVFPFGWGMMGAALAGGISQTVSWLIVLSHFLRKKGDLRLRRFKPNAKLYREIVFRGLPTTISQFSTSVTTICMNHVLIANIGAIAVNSFSIMSYVASLTMSILFGVSDGLQPLFGQTYGAKEEKELKFYMRSGTMIVVIGSAAIVLIEVLFSQPICALFGADADTLAYAVKYMPQYAWGFVVAGVNTLISTYLYSTERINYAIVLNVLLSFVVNILITLGLPAIFGGGIVWYTFGIYEAIILVVGYAMIKHSERNGIVYK